MADFLENVAVVLGTMAAVAAVLGIVLGGAYWVGNSRAWRWAEPRLVSRLVPLRNWAGRALFVVIWIASVLFMGMWAFRELGFILGALFLVFVAPALALLAATASTLAAPVLIAAAIMAWIIWSRGA